MGDYSIVNDSGGNICGIWLRDSNQASNKNIIAMLLMKEKGGDNLVELALSGNFRIVPNSFDEKGGVFIMFNSKPAPGEVQEQKEKPYEHEGRMMCKQCQNEDLSKMMLGGKEGSNSLDPILGADGRWFCIYHGELTEEQMFFVPFLNEDARMSYLKHEDRVLQKLGMGKYAGQGNTVSSQDEILSRMKELKSELGSDEEYS